MLKKILLLSVMTGFITVLHAQSGRSATAYAITASAKGQHDWKEVRLIDIKTGKEIQSVFTSKQETEILNARTGKPVQKKDNIAKTEAEQTSVQVYTIDANNKPQLVTKNVDLDKLRASGNKVVVFSNKHITGQQGYDKPFATNSAAMAYDKKHERLYYTPMGINQLRYIDLKSNKVYYFEDEAFGVVQGQWDVAGQITRMVIASDGNGYALSNDANHLIRFTTGKKAEITDLGAVSDAPANGDFSIHRGVGGDMIADNAGNLYLVTAYRNVWKINIETLMAEYKGGIKGLPEDYQTNGAAVEEGSKIIVASSRSTAGYYRFDLNTLQAEKVTGEEEVFNASDLANANLASVKKEEKKEEKPKEEVAQPVKTETVAAKQETPVEEIRNNNITVYPNPVTDGLVKLSFSNQPTGKYNVQVLDMSGQILSTSDMVLNSKNQVMEIKLPGGIAKGSYFIRVASEDGRNNLTTKLIVQ
ncbi:MAG TPA: T9SS type A sorting domain-containing protein [Ferruginibacter sp.]|nr:T9SS type A sorting domain-containing protein [Ferruginibacter sp.]